MIIERNMPTVEELLEFLNKIDPPRCQSRDYFPAMDLALYYEHEPVAFAFGVELGLMLATYRKIKVEQEIEEVEKSR